MGFVCVHTVYAVSY